MWVPDEMYEAPTNRERPVLLPSESRDLVAVAKLAATAQPVRTERDIPDRIALIEQVMAACRDIVNALADDAHKGLNGALGERFGPSWDLNFAREINQVTLGIVGNPDPDGYDDPNSLWSRFHVANGREDRKAAA